MMKLTTIQVTQSAADELKRYKKELPVKKAADVLDIVLNQHKKLQQTNNNHSITIVDLQEKIDDLRVYPELIKQIFPDKMTGPQLKALRKEMKMSELEFCFYVGLTNRGLRNHFHRGELGKVFINTLRGAFIDFAFYKNKKG